MVDGSGTTLLGGTPPALMPAYPLLSKSEMRIPLSPPFEQLFEMTLLSIVTAPRSAIARPHTIRALLVSVML